MKIAFLMLALAVTLAAPARLTGQGGRIMSVDPDSGKPGDTVAAIGEGVDKANVAELYLTDGTNDIKVAIVEQTATTIRFTIPANCKSGRYNLMIKTAGKVPQLLEQPVKLQVG